MSHLVNALRAAIAAALMGGFACLCSTTATADPNTGNSSDVNTLASNLSKGYGLNNCTAQPITGSQLAALTCGQSPDPSGPVQAKYFLFSSGDDLANWFKNSIKDDVLTTCGERVELHPRIQQRCPRAIPVVADQRLTYTIGLQLI
jgi:hypothetical protein